MKTSFRAAVSLAVLAFVLVSATGWGPRTELAIVNTAVQLISQEGAIPLRRLARHVQAGAAISDQRLEELFPVFRQAPLETIDAEMDLLRTVEGSQIDPYFAFRLGVLGKLVANVTAPMFNANPAYQRQYYADVDQAIERTELQSTKRQIVDPGTHIREIMQQAAEQESMLEREYAEGIGFTGVGRTALSQDASRSVRAVADVWFTILTGQSAVGGISERQIHQYILGAMQYYIDRGNAPEINAAYERLAKLNVGDETLYQQIGNMFFDAGLYERAIVEYEKVLATNPNNRDVAQRMAEYYARMGELAVEAGNLEPAFEYFNLATQTNKLHPTAQQNLFRVEKLIAERQERMAEQQKTLEQAQELQRQADVLATERKYAVAVTTLNQAHEQYQAISDEFPQIAQERNLGLKNVQSRLSELQQELIGNAQNLSGAGYIVEAQRLAAQADDLSEEGLRTLTRAQYQEQLQELRRKYEAMAQP